MAMFPYTATVSSNFVCTQQAHAGVREKRQHLHTAMPWSSRVYVNVSAFVGTHADFVNRTSAHHYSAHVPEAPVMLGADRTRAYAAGEAATAWGNLNGRLRSIALAGLVGAVLGVAAVVLATCIIALAAALGFMQAGVTLAVFCKIAAGYAGIMGGIAMGVEAYDWARGHRKFKDLHLLSQGYDQVAAGSFNQASIDLCQVLVDKAYGESDWALRHAAREYDLELQHQRQVQAEKTAA